MEWTEVDPLLFDAYPSPQPLKGPDDMDAVLDAVAAGKTVEVTLADDSVVRGRRMSLGRRAKARGLVLQMRAQANKLIVRQEGAAEPQPEKPQGPRKRKD